MTQRPGKTPVMSSQLISAIAAVYKSLRTAVGMQLFRRRPTYIQPEDLSHVATSLVAPELRCGGGAARGTTQWTESARGAQ